MYELDKLEFAIGELENLLADYLDDEQYDKITNDKRFNDVYKWLGRVQHEYELSRLEGTDGL